MPHLRTAIEVLIAFFLALGTALTALWSQGEVTQFSDISQVAYAVAFIGSSMVALQTLRARLGLPPPGTENAQFVEVKKGDM